MLFDDEELSGRRLFGKKYSRQRAAVLKANAFLNGRREKGLKGLGGPALALALAACVLAGTAGALWALGGALFARNERYTVKRLDIVDGQVIGSGLIREYTGLHEGVNLFGFDIDSVRRNFLSEVPAVKAVEIRRQLPDTLSIRVTDRIPLARLEQPGPPLVADAEGVVFALGSCQWKLPLVRFRKGPGIRPGDRLDGMLKDAIMVLDMAGRSSKAQELVIEGIDARGNFKGLDDAMCLYLPGKDRVYLWWDRAKGDDRGQAELRERLHYLRGLVRRAREEGRPLGTVDLTLETYLENTTSSPKWM